VVDATAAAHVSRQPTGMVAELVRVTHTGQVVHEARVDRDKSILEWR
jgi:hypothetical protein